MTILIATDPHGLQGLQRAEYLAKEYGAHAMIITGDCWDIHFPRGIETHVIRGNHEHEPYWVAEQGAPNVHRHEDYTTFELDGVKFGVLGRMDEDTHYHLLMRGYWLGDEANRAMAKYDLDWVARRFEGCDVLLFHDAPAPFEFATRERTGSPYLQEITERVQPEYVFHGHMHEANLRRYTYGTKVVGMAPIDPRFDVMGFALLETDPLRVEYYHDAPGALTTETFDDLP